MSARLRPGRVLLTLEEFQGWHDEHRAMRAQLAERPPLVPSSTWRERLRQARDDYTNVDRAYKAALREVEYLKRMVAGAAVDNSQQRLVNELGAKLNATRADLDAALRSEATVRGQLERAQARIRELTLTPEQRKTAAGIARRLDS